EYLHDPGHLPDLIGPSDERNGAIQGPVSNAVHYLRQVGHRANGCTEHPQITQTGEQTDHQGANYSLPGYRAHEGLRGGERHADEQDANRLCPRILNWLVDGEIGLSQDRRRTVVAATVSQHRIVSRASYELGADATRSIGVLDVGGDSSV